MACLVRKETGMDQRNYSRLAAVILRRLPAVRAARVEHVELVASRPLLVQIDLPVFRFTHSSLLPYANRRPGCFLSG